jgi:Zn-dependent protease with chaperone function
LRDRSTLLRRSVLPLAAASVTLIATVLLVAGLLPETVLPGGAAATGIDAWEGSAGPAVGASHDLVGFDDALLADIERYRAPRRSIALLAFVVSVTVPLLMAVALRDGRAVRTLTLARLLPSTALQAAAAAGIVVLVTALARLPLSVWSGVVHDGRWGFRTRSAPGWLLDHLAVVGGRALGVGALVWMFAALILRHPRDWSARVVLLTAVVGPVALLLHPLVIHPVLLPTGPMPDGAHSDAVAAVIARSDIEVPVLLGEASLRTTRRNAVATGLGPTARIVLHDTLLELEPREVAAITAHEVAHLERRDPLRAALAPVPFVMLLTWLLQRRLRSRGRPDVRTLAAVASLVLALEAAATPVTAGLSRTIEHRADVRSVQLSQDPSAHVTMLRAFVTDGLADPDPPRWTVLLRATHPTPRERIVAVSGGSGPATR